MNRQYWMVQYAKGKEPTQFKFCESRGEAEKSTEYFRSLGYKSSCWEL